MAEQNEYQSKLNLFFKKKSKIDKISRQIKSNARKKIPKNFEELKFVSTNQEFKLTNKNDVAMLTIKRFKKRNIREILHEVKHEIQNDRNHVLMIKFNLLFEYAKIEDYETIFRDQIEPRESKTKKNEKHVTKMTKVLESKKISTKTQEQNLSLEIGAYKDELRNISDTDKTSKKEIMKLLIEKQKELFDIKKEEIHNENTIHEI